MQGTIQGSVQRNVKVGIVMLMLGAVLGWAGQSVTPSRASSPEGKPAGVQTVSAAPVLQSSAVSFTEIAKAVTPAVVNITATASSPVSESMPREFRDRFKDFFGSPWGPFGGPEGEFPRGPRGPHDPREPQGQGMGSGVIVSPDGYIVTNNHVVDGAREITVTLPNKREFAARLIGTDPKTDVAVLKIEGKDLPYVPWGDSTTLQVGEPVLAIGNPFGLNSTVTSGIVSALGRGRMGITQYEDFIQTDAAINPGNSGGALVNTKGELIGINTAIFSRTGGYQGVGFAIPTKMAKPVFESLVKTGKVVRGYLGIGIQDLTQDLAKTFGLKQTQGALVSDVKEGTPADRGGLTQGDVSIRYQGAPVEDPVALQRMVTATTVGTKATVTVMRDGRETNLTITIGEQPDSTRVARAGEERGDSALAGLAVQELDQKTARELGLSPKTHGVVVVNVEPGSQADRAGVARGDVIREINRKPITSVKDFEQVSGELSKDQTVLLLVNRRGSSLFLTMKV